MNGNEGGRGNRPGAGPSYPRSNLGDRGTGPVAGKRTLTEQLRLGVPPVQRKIDGDDGRAQGSGQSGQVKPSRDGEASPLRSVAASLSIFNVFGRPRIADAATRGEPSIDATDRPAVQRKPGDVTGDMARDGTAGAEIADRGGIGESEASASAPRTDGSRISILDCQPVGHDTTFREDAHYQLEDGASWGNAFTDRGAVIRCSCNDVEQAADATVCDLPLRECAEWEEVEDNASSCAFRYAGLCSGGATATAVAALQLVIIRRWGWIGELERGPTSCTARRVPSGTS